MPYIKEENINITIHTTFLDPYGGRDSYGSLSTWSDNYFSRGFTDVATGTVLDNAYNVDITWLDLSRHKTVIHKFTSFGNNSEICYEKVSSHSWPHEFYTGSVPPKEVLDSEGFGFPLSKEGGQWEAALKNFPVKTFNAHNPKILGNGDVSCIPISSKESPYDIDIPRSFAQLPENALVFNSLEHIEIEGTGVTLRTASPAWLIAYLPITNAVNFVSFETLFSSSSPAQGLLTIYWETNVLGSIEERLALPGFRRHTFSLPRIAKNETRELGFRLEAFSNLQSSVTVTNVAFGFEGVREPFSLSFAGRNKDGLPIFQLTGPSGHIYRVESSIDMAEWSSVAILENTTGIVAFVDIASTNTTSHFYRALVP